MQVLGTCFVRKAMDYLFTQRELKWLDDLMPEAAKKEKEDSGKLSEDDADKDSEEKEVGPEPRILISSENVWLNKDFFFLLARCFSPLSVLCSAYSW